MGMYTLSFFLLSRIVINSSSFTLKYLDLVTKLYTHTSIPFKSDNTNLENCTYTLLLCYCLVRATDWVPSIRQTEALCERNRWSHCQSVEGVSPGIRHAGTGGGLLARMMRERSTWPSRRISGWLRHRVLRTRYGGKWTTLCHVKASPKVRKAAW